MKKYKFRAWNKAEKRWATADEVQTFEFNSLQDRYGGGKEVYLEIPDNFELELIEWGLGTSEFKEDL